ncbi:polyketide cyclase [Williamsia herbipolensis]|uniref:Polyketide cyclase n=1 Tax=Williamsia herbipolensis TaxID=1603258 RepID=A0AAU4JZG6_9NOCA|nr:polyketide cyclase [Williamsia herbipolensis]
MIADRWGVDTAETSRLFPCDDIVSRPVLQAWRGVTVHATPDRVWPWIGQLRLAPYSYDWIDNLGRRSPAELTGLPEPVVGEHFMSCGGRPLGEILDVVPNEALTGEIAGAVMSYVLVPTGEHTRLLLKIVMARGRLIAPLVSVGDLLMARRQLLNLKALSEMTEKGH